MQHGTRSGLLTSMQENATYFVNGSNNRGATDLKCYSFLFLQNWIGALTLSLMLELAPRKLVPWFVPRIFFFLRIFCISINLPCSFTENTALISRLEPIGATGKCWINYKNGYVELLLLDLLPLLNPSLIVKTLPT